MLTPSLAENQRVPCSVLITPEDTSLSMFTLLVDLCMFMLVIQQHSVTSSTTVSSQERQDVKFKVLKHSVQCIVRLVS